MTSSIAPAVERPVGWLALLIGWALALLSACGGTDGDVPTQIRPEPDSVTATAYVGVDGFTPVLVQVKGVEGILRNAVLAAPNTYMTTLNRLSGPYAISLRSTEDASVANSQVVSLATEPGAVNVTPLTTLAVAQLFGQSPVSFYNSLGNVGDPALAVVTDATLADAQQQVRRYLRQQLGFSVPDGVGDFFTASFSPRPGDPMFDTIVALNAHLAARSTDVFAVAEQVAAEANLCTAESLTVTTGGDERDFCPAQKSAQPDETDSTITNYRFTNSAGTELTVAGRGADVLTVTLQQPDAGPLFSCSGAGCAGIALGTPAGDQSRPIVFSLLRLTGTTGAAVLDGTLQSSPPGPSFPPLPCDNRYYVAYPDGRVDAACAALDTLIGAGIGDSSIFGTTRRGYTFRSDGTVEPDAAALEVRADGEQVASVFVRDVDPETGETRTLFKCQGSACSGVTIGPARDDADSFAPFILRYRLMTLNDTQLTAFNADGTPSAAGPATVRATLDSFEIVYPEGFFPPPDACRSALLRLEATVSDEAQPVEICPPSTDISEGSGFPYDPFLNTTLDAGGNPSFFIATSYGSFGGDGGGLRITLSGDSIATATFLQYNGGSYRCEGAACSGITISPPNSAGERTLSLSGAVLQEFETGGLPGDRSATINGSFTAPAAYVP